MMHFDENRYMMNMRRHHLYENILDDVEVDEVDDKDYDHEADVRISIYSKDNKIPNNVKASVGLYLDSLVKKGIVYENFNVSFSVTQNKMFIDMRMNLDSNSVVVFCRFIVYICYYLGLTTDFELKVEKFGRIDDIAFEVIDKRADYYQGVICYRNVEKLARELKTSRDSVIKCLFLNMQKCGMDVYVDEDDKLYAMFLEKDIICIVKKDGSVLFDISGCKHYINKNRKFHCGFLRLDFDWGVNYVKKSDGTLISPDDFYWGTEFNNGIAIVMYRNEQPKRYALISTDGKQLSSLRFERVGTDNTVSERCLNDELIVVKGPDDKMNYIKRNGEILIKNKWFSTCRPFMNGYGVVRGINGYQLVDANGDFVFKQDVYCSAMAMQDNGLVLVTINGKKNFINPDKQENGFLLAEPASYCKNFKNGFAIVRFGDDEALWNYIDKDGNFLFPKHMKYSFCCDFDDGGNALVYKGTDKFNFIYTNGKLLSETWFDEYDERVVPKFFDGYAKIYIKNLGFNIIGRDGKIFSKIWFDKMNMANTHIVYVETDGRGDMMRYDGTLLVGEDRDICITEDTFFENDVAIVKNGDDKNNVIRKDGSLVFDEWFECIEDQVDNLYELTQTEFDKNGHGITKFNIINGNGEYLLDKWVNIAKIRLYDSYESNIVIVDDNGLWNAASSKTGKLVLKNWTNEPIKDLRNGMFKVGVDALVDDEGNFVTVM